MKVKVNDIEVSSENIVSVYDAIKEAGLMTRDVIAASMDGKTVELTKKAEEGCNIIPLEFSDEAGKDVFNHTASHILAQAV